MPELPEVETVARQLSPILKGRALRAVRILDSKLNPGPLREVRGMIALGAIRMGKMVAIELSGTPETGRRWILVHLRMTGRLIWSEGPAVRLAELERKPRARFLFEGGVLEFFDTRRFGIVRILRSTEEAGLEGLDPLSRAFTPARLRGLLGGSIQPVKPWLLRQDRILGIGNIYASEILHAAKVDPRRPANSLSDEETARIHGETRRILRRAIRWCGVTFSDFQDSRGSSGSYGRYLKVYGREGDPCASCGNSIRRLVQQQRSGFYCPHCQG